MLQNWIQRGSRHNICTRKRVSARRHAWVNVVQAMYQWAQHGMGTTLLADLMILDGSALVRVKLHHVLHLGSRHALAVLRVVEVGGCLCGRVCDVSGWMFVWSYVCKYAYMCLHVLVKTRT